MIGVIKIWYISRYTVRHKEKVLMLRKYSYGIILSGTKKEAQLNKQYDSILCLKSSKEKR